MNELSVWAQVLSSYSSTSSVWLLTAIKMLSPRSRVTSLPPQPMAFFRSLWSILHHWSLLSLVSEIFLLPLWWPLLFPFQVHAPLAGHWKPVFFKEPILFHLSILSSGDFPTPVASFIRDDSQIDREWHIRTCTCIHTYTHIYDTYMCVSINRY